MPKPRILEICVQSEDHAVAAECGGADRIELCDNLPSGGTTPSARLIQSVRERVEIPVHVLIRPRAGDFCYSDVELETMRAEIQIAKERGANGVVFGVLDTQRHVNIDITGELVDLARPLPVTFHRAFDIACETEKSLEDVIQTGAARILTSAGSARALDAIPRLSQLVRAAGEKIIVMPCGGINPENIKKIAKGSEAYEFHSSAGTSGIGMKSASEFEPRIFEERVRSLVQALNEAVSKTDPNWGLASG